MDILIFISTDNESEFKKPVDLLSFVLTKTLPYLRSLAKNLHQSMDKKDQIFSFNDMGEM